MHYANCATFNADFDGDEINLHLPQARHRYKLQDGSLAGSGLQKIGARHTTSWLSGTFHTAYLHCHIPEG